MNTVTCQGENEWEKEKIGNRGEKWLKDDGANGFQKLMVVKLYQTRKTKFTAKEVQLLFVFETTPQILW